VERYKADGAKVLFLTMGCLSEVAEVAVDELQAAGESVGLIKLRLWRPFPFADLRQALAEAELVIVCDRALSPGGAAPPVLAEVRSALYAQAHRPQTLGYIIGLGGRDVNPEAFKDILAKAKAERDEGSTKEFHLYGVRG
jgi:pyruvate ferredoxin oxidoreductase alpha subunit